MARAFHSWLFRRAKDIAEASRRQADEIKEEILELEEKKVKADSAFDLASSAVQRLDNFEPEIGGDFQCPDCWVRDGVRSTLRPIDSSDNTDWFKCGICHVEIPIE